MQRLIVDITNIYNDLQGRKHQRPDYFPSGAEAMKDRFVIQANVNGDTIDIKGCGFNSAILPVANAYKVDNNLRNCLFGGSGPCGSEPCVIFNGRVIPFDVLHDGDSVFFSVTMPSITAYPMPSKVVATLIHPDTAIDFLRKEVNDKNKYGILDDISLMLASTVGLGKEICMLSHSTVTDGTDVFTAATLMDYKTRLVTDDLLSMTGRPPELSRFIVHMFLSSSVKQRSGNRHFLIVYPGIRSTYQIKAIYAPDDIGVSKSCYNILIGAPSFCLER